MPIAFPEALRRSITNVPLRWVLTIPFVLPTIGAVALVGYFSYQSGHRAVTGLADQLMEKKGDQVALYLERTLEVPHLINQLNADSIRLGQLPGLETQDPEPLEKALWTQLLRFPDVTSIAFANERGGMIGSGRLYEPQSIVMSVYRTAQFAEGTYSLSTTDTQGNIIETKTIAQNYDARTKPWYQTPAQAGKATWSPIYKYVSHLDTLGISAGLPIYTNSGELQGVLAADINLKKLNEFLSGLQFSSSGQVFIIERSGLLVASSTHQSLFTTQAGKEERLKAGESENPIMRETMAQLATRFGSLTNLEAIQQFTIEQSESPKWVRVTPFQDRYGLDWLIVVVIPESDFLGAIHANRNTTLLFCLMTLTGAIGLGTIATNQLTTRFAQLNRVSRELASGNLDQRLPTNGSIYELNGLAQTFNQMADQLQQSFDRINTALAESEEKFTTISRNSPDPMAIASLVEERILEVNDSQIEFFGYSRAEMLGRTTLELNLWHNPEEREQFRALLQQQGRVRNLEVQLSTKSGEVRTVLVSAEMRALEGQDCVIVVLRDISDRKATERILQQSEARYRAIVEDQTELITRSLPDTTFVFVNDAYCRYFDVQREDLIGKSYQPFIYADDRDRVLQRMHSLSITNPTTIEENRVVVKGDLRWTQWVNRMLFDEQGNFIEYQSVGRDITELKQTEEALRRSEANLLQAQQMAHVGSWEFDLETQQISWSEELFRIFGFDPTQLEPSYAEVMEIVPAEDRRILTMAINQAIENGTPYEVEHRIYRPDGTLRYVISKGQAVLNEQQRVFKLYGTALDITNRKTTEIALQQYERIVSATTDAISLIDRQYRYQIVNQTYLDWNHKAYAEIIGHSVSDLVGQEVFERIIQPHLDRCFAGETVQYSEWFEFPALGPQFVSVTYSPYLNLDQTIAGAVVSVRNITPLKQAEIALRESEERFQEIAQTLNQVSYVVSLTTGQYLYISPSYERLWGYSCESLYQDPRSWLDRIHPEDLEYVLQGFNQLLSGNQVRLEYRIICANGEVHWIKSESLVVHDEDGNPLRVVGLADDITDRKQLEQSLRSQAEEERLLTAITQNIRQSLELDRILATTVIEIQQTLNADRVLVFRINQDGSGQVIQEAVVPDYRVTDQMRWEDEHFPADCYAYYQQGIPRIVPDVATDAWAECLVEFMQEVGVKSKVVAPIVQGSGESSTQVWGLLVVHACSHYRQWQDSEADFLQRICNQLAIAIDQANLYQQLQAELAEHKQTEAALQEREAMLRAIGDNLPKGFIYQRVYESGKGFYYSYVSAGVERLLGLKPEAILENPQTTRSVGFAEELARADQMAQESLKNLTPIELQMRHRTPQGEIQWSSIRSTPRRLDDGRIVWDGIEVDITDLKQAEAALRTSEEQFRRAFDDAPIGVSLVTMAGQFIKVNSRYCDLLGYTEAELLTLTFQEITHPADLDDDLEGLRQMLAGEIDSFQLEKRYITKQGNIVPVLMNAALIYDQDGQPLYSVGHVQDIRDRLKVERMKDEFISVVSHELRTPLTSIRGALGMLGSGVFDNRPERAKHMLQIAIDNSDRLVRLVDDILSLERLKSDKVQLSREQCQVADLIKQTVESIQSLADQAGITLSCTSLFATLWVAPDAIVQTLTNLLSNAIKFSSPGDTVWLKVEVSKMREIRETGEITNTISPSSPSSPSSRSIHPPYILFTVKDQGRGIPEDKLEIIFEQFQQVDVSDSRKKGGTGLGLAICKKIVQQHQGQIWVESCLGKGSTFYFALPMHGTDDWEG